MVDYELLLDEECYSYKLSLNYLLDNANHQSFNFHHHESMAPKPNDPVNQEC